MRSWLHAVPHLVAAASVRTVSPQTRGEEGGRKEKRNNCVPGGCLGV